MTKTRMCLSQFTKCFVSETEARLKRDPYCGSELIVLGALKYLICWHTLAQLTRKEPSLCGCVFLCTVMRALFQQVAPHAFKNLRNVFALCAFASTLSIWRAKGKQNIDNKN